MNLDKVGKKREKNKVSVSENNIFIVIGHNIIKHYGFAFASIINDRCEYSEMKIFLFEFKFLQIHSLHANNSVWTRNFREKIPWNIKLLGFFLKLKHKT
jgi:hypothetical protein